MLGIFIKRATVKQLHDEIDESADRLVREAREILQIPVSRKELDISLEEKATMLEKLGFVSTPEVLEIKKLIAQEAIVETNVAQKRAIAQIHLSYLVYYPKYKFLTEDVFNRICEKYGLIYAPVGAYSGNVPLKNLMEIGDTPVLAESLRPSDVNRIRARKFVNGVFLTKEQRKILKNTWIPLDSEAQVDNVIRSGIDSIMGHWGSDRIRQRVEGLLGKELTERIKTVVAQWNVLRRVKTGLFIASQPSDFKLDKVEKESIGYFEESIYTIPDDPIVFRFTAHGVQIITAWGPEAKIPEIVNEIKN